MNTHFSLLSHFPLSRNLSPTLGDLEALSLEMLLGVETLLLEQEEVDKLVEKVS